MKILAFADTHASKVAIRKIKELAKQENPDILICAGDISIFEQNLNKIVADICQIKKPILIIHGNHEEEFHLARACRRVKNCKFIHASLLEVNDFLVVAWGGGGFDFKDRAFERFIKKFDKQIRAAKKVILVTHAPPYKTNTDMVAESHVGCKSFSNIVKKYNNIKLVICGHIHETAGKQDRINHAKIINPGPFGKIINIS